MKCRRLMVSLVLVAFALHAGGCKGEDQFEGKLEGKFEFSPLSAPDPAPAATADTPKVISEGVLVAQGITFGGPDHGSTPGYPFAFNDIRVTGGNHERSFLLEGPDGFSAISCEYKSKAGTNSPPADFELTFEGKDQVLTARWRGSAKDGWMLPVKFILKVRGPREWTAKDTYTLKEL